MLGFREGSWLRRITIAKLSIVTVKGQGSVVHGHHVLLKVCTQPTRGQFPANWRRGRTLGRATCVGH